MGWSIKKALKGAGGAIEDATHVVGSEAERGAQSVNREWKHWGRDAYRDVLYGGYGVALREIGKHNGYNAEERQSLGRSFGANYASVEGAKDMRTEENKMEGARQRGIAIQLANDRADRYSAAARIRRRTGGNQPGNKGGTLLTGALGLLGGTSPTLGSA
jgi:hypothetical protein